MKTRWVAVLCCITLAAMLAYGQTADEGYQPARIVSVEKLAASAQHPENGDQYKIFMRMGDTVYSCHASGPPALFMEWTPGKEFPAKLNGKVLQVKSPNGEIAELNIVGKKIAK